MRAALRLLWALDVRHVLTHRGRLALSALGIAVGVALGVSVGSLSTSITGSLRSIAQAAASDANVEVRPNGNAALDPRLLAVVRSVDGVRNAGATVESYVRVRNPSDTGREARVLALGVDSGVIAMSPRATDAETIATNDPLGLIVPASVADDLGVRAGGEIELTTPSGWTAVPVGTVLDADAAERTRVVVGTVGILQQVLGRGEGFDAIYVEADDADEAIVAIAGAVGDAARVGEIAFRSEQVQQLLASANASFAVGTLVALFVGAFLVYNTMSMAAAERIGEAALLRAVGARRRQVFMLFLAEGGVLGLIGSALGVVLGLLLASRLLTQQGGALEEIYPVQITTLSVSGWVLAAAGVAGLVASVAAAYLPARRISRADPAPALGPTGVFEDPVERSRRATTIVGAACCVIGPAVVVPTLATTTEISAPVLAGFGVTMTGIALLIPTAIPALARMVFGRVAAMRRTPGVVRLAMGEVLRSPARTSFTVGAVLLSLSLVIGFSIAQSSIIRAFDAGFDDIISADLYVRSATWRPFGSDVRMDERIADGIETIDGVEAAWPFLLMPATYDDRAIAILAYDLDEYARHTDVDADARRTFLAQAEAVGDRDAVLVSSSFLPQFDVEVGQTIDIPTPTGRHSLEIAATFHDPAAITPEVMFDHDTFRRLWGTGGADSFAVATEPGREADVAAEIERTIAADLGAEVDTRSEYLDLLSSAITSVTQLIGSVQLVAVIVAALGLANTLLISTFERRRDLGVLRAVGMLRRQLRRMVAVEALLIGSLGVVCAWGLGTAIGYGMYALVEAQLGVPLEPVFPPLAYAGAAVIGLLVALGASVYPAQRAARLDVVEALQYE